MNDLLLNLGITAVLEALRESVKNAERKAKLKAVMLKIATTIFAVFPDDPEFDPQTPSFKAKVKKEASRL